MWKSDVVEVLGGSRESQDVHRFIHHSSSIKLTRALPPIQQLPSMSMSIVNSVPYPFHFKQKPIYTSGTPGLVADALFWLPNVRGKIPSIQASRLRTMMLDATQSPEKILAYVCTYDGLTSRLVEAGFPMVFLAGYPVARTYGLPDTGYIATSEMCDKIRDAYHQTTLPVMADGDSGYGSPMNVKRTVECFAQAGAAGIMIEDQTRPKRKFPNQGA
jgi:isocitrate lyase